MFEGLPDSRIPQRNPGNFYLLSFSSRLAHAKESVRNPGIKIPAFRFAACGLHAGIKRVSI
jgi:hypothetical protein